MAGYRFVVYLFWSDGKLGKMGEGTTCFIILKLKVIIDVSVLIPHSLRDD